MLQRAYDLWSELEQESGASLMRLTGGLMMGVPAGRVVSGSRETAIEQRLPYEYLDADEIRRRFPGLCPPDSYDAVVDARAGYLRADDVLRTHLALAQRHGATLLFGEPVVSWEATGTGTGTGTGVSVSTPTRRYHAGRLVLAVGAWTARVVPDLALPLRPERQVVAWFDPPATGDDFAPDRFPIFICEHELGRSVYGFPRLSTGVKAAVYHEGELFTDPAEVRRTIDPEEITRLRTALARFAPALAQAPLRGSATCLFTAAPDSRFVIDVHPAHESVVICSACSGHGFKFCNAIGEVNADLVTGRPARYDLSVFALTRFASAP